MATPPTQFPNMSPEAPQAAAPKKQNILIWILGGCGTVLVLFILVAVIGVRTFVKRNVHVGPNGEVDVQVGGMSVHGGKAQDVGIPVYPGVDTSRSSGVEMTIPSAKNGPVTVTTAVYSSKDSLDKVDAWYLQNLGSDYARQGPGAKQTTAGDKTFPIPMEYGAIAYMSTRDDVMYAVSLNSLLGTTQIKLMRANIPAPATTRQPQ
jgi:hypothetical protein